MKFFDKFAKQNKAVLLVSISIMAVFVLSACANTSATETAPLDYNTQAAEEQTAEIEQQNDVAPPTSATLLNDTEITHDVEEPSEIFEENFADDVDDIEIRNPYIIATTIEEIKNILALQYDIIPITDLHDLQEGIIPVTNIEVSASSLGFPNGIIITITEQDLQDALDVLSEALKQGSLLAPTFDFVTPFIELSPTIDEMNEGQLFAHFRMFVNYAAHEHSDFDMFNDQFTDEERELVNAEGERLLAEYGRNAMFEEETLYNTARLVFGGRFDFE